MDIKVKILECTEKKFEEKVYYSFMVCDADDKSETPIPISMVNGSKPYAVGSLAPLSFYRNKDFKLCVRII